MSRVQFWILNAVSLVVAALIGLELRAEHQLDDVEQLLKQTQAPVLQAQQNMPLIQQMIQRVALGATRDPALKDLLAKYGFQLTMKAFR